MSEDKSRELREAAPKYDEDQPIKVNWFPGIPRVSSGSDRWKTLKGSVLEEGDLITPVPDVWNTEIDRP